MHNCNRRAANVSKSISVQFFRTGAIIVFNFNTTNFLSEYHWSNSCDSCARYRRNKSQHRSKIRGNSYSYQELLYPSTLSGCITIFIFHCSIYCSLLFSRYALSIVWRPLACSCVLVYCRFLYMRHRECLLPGLATLYICDAQIHLSYVEFDGAVNASHLAFSNFVEWLTAAHEQSSRHSTLKGILKGAGRHYIFSPSLSRLIEVLVEEIICMSSLTLYTYPWAIHSGHSRVGGNIIRIHICHYPKIRTETVF